MLVLRAYCSLVVSPTVAGGQSHPLPLYVQQERLLCLRLKGGRRQSWAQLSVVLAVRQALALAHERAAADE